MFIKYIEYKEMSENQAIEIFLSTAQLNKFKTINPFNYRINKF